MFQGKLIETGSKAEFYRDLALQLRSLLEGERDAIANAANTSALLYELMPDINWAGFYFLRGGNELIVGPFQGKPACVRIPVGRGVCGTAVERGRSILVEDVHAFPGHIACDAASRSELVVPLIQGWQDPGRAGSGQSQPEALRCRRSGGHRRSCRDLRRREFIGPPPKPRRIVSRRRAALYSRWHNDFSDGGRSP